MLARPRLGANLLLAGGAVFAAWAPRCERVELECDGRRTPMEREDDDVWQAVVWSAGPGSRYRYWLDGEGPFPDPYARSLPEGVHGPAEVVDPSAFAWSDDGWPGLTSEGLVVYELHVGAFTPEGTFDAAVEQLDELARLGVGAIELMPVSSFPGRRNWGYDGVGHYAPAAVYGGPDGLRRLVDAAHRRGLGVILDVVYNHLGPDGNYLGAFSSDYFTDRFRTPWGDALDYASPWTRAWAIDNAVHWLVEYRLDGLRLDATAQIHDPSPKHLLRELAERCRAAVPRPVVLIAEDSRNDPRLVRPTARRGYGLDAVWADDFHHAVRTLLTGQRDGYYRDYQGQAAEVASAIQHGFLYRGQHAPSLGRPRGAPTGRVPGHAFVFCIENHDQVGNQALGERLGHLVSPPLYRAASALLLLSPETPLLFMGQEFAASTPFFFFTDHRAELGRRVTAGRRKEFAGFAAFAEHPERVPDPQADETFLRSKLDVADRDRNAGVYRLYCDLLRLRRGDPTLRQQNRLGLLSAPLGQRALAFTAGVGPARRLVVANFGPAGELRLPSRLQPDGDWRRLLTTDDPAYGGAGTATAIQAGRALVPAETTALFGPA
ncbi:MAG TPA: malto-oligosyltrehalose trehalohydrolase [Chloroflexota bacterium]|jgi:maltooligosyltrehalose trehalohydrolase|nr:malto-oligosyltrehalose trehalohydrolase [Chloroflexota bacterium]